MIKALSAGLSIMVAAFSFAACAPHQQYRTVYPDVCISKTKSPSADCEGHAIQELPTGNGSRYLLGFIEFDDQGQLWDRDQMHDVLTRLFEESATNELLMVVFVHGWKHSAAPGDGNIDTFRRVLADLSDTEAYLAGYGGPNRKVAGVYLGWRGGTLDVPYLKNLTFWNRKNTSQKVGHGGVTEVLSRLEDVKMTKDSVACGQDKGQGKTDNALCGSLTRLVVVGHSMGGAVVHTALGQILENRFVQTKGPAGRKSDVAGFGNLVVLINPAFEANLFTPLSDMATERKLYFDSQLPVLLSLTSEADNATGVAFPIGRWFSTLFEKEHDRKRLNKVSGQVETIKERDTNVIAIGHYEPYRTHRLYPATERKRSEISRYSIERSVELFLKFSESWKNDHSGSKIPFGDVILERTRNSAGRNPYLITYVDKALIRDHNDIADTRIIEFIKQLILLSSYNQMQTEDLRDKILKSK